MVESGNFVAYPIEHMGEVTAPYLNQHIVDDVLILRDLILGSSATATHQGGGRHRYRA